MQGLKQIQDFAARDEVPRRAEMLWAVGVVVVVAVLVAVVSVFYINPPGRVEYRAEMSESGGISAGTEVRVAGIPAGSVSEVTLAEDKVEVKLSVESSVFIGDQTSLEVRMLTVVGGAYVALVPAGGKPLGNNVIPIDRTTVPYSTAQVLDAAAHTVDDIDAQTLRKVSVSVTDSLDAAPGAVRGIMSDVEKLTSLINQQQDQIRGVAAIGDEYTTELVAHRETLQEMIRRIRAVLPVMVGYKDRGMVTYAALADMVLYVGDIFGEPYMTRIKPPLTELIGAADDTQAMAQRMDETITSLRGIADNLAGVLGPNGADLDFGDQVVDNTEICIPIAGRQC
ncbi:MlaD family protein [Williamsia sp.]|uniref:MlaD family protein n=1 Tax=Williamsia sp. TaxID=1872085 RepID=UPI002F94EF8B